MQGPAAGRLHVEPRPAPFRRGTGSAACRLRPPKGEAQFGIGSHSTVERSTLEAPFTNRNVVL